MHIAPSGKRYVGITSKSTTERWKNGFGYKTQMFYRAIEKYGWNNIQHIIIAENLSEEKAKQLEIELIDKHKTNDSNFGYNLTIGGDGTNGFKMSDETKRKLSQIHTGKKLSVETRKKISERNKGVNPVPIRDEAFRLKMAKAKIGIYPTIETRMKMSNSQRGRVMSEEAKRKISESRMGNKHWNYGKKLPNDWKEKIRNGCKGIGNKAVIQMTLGNEIIREFESVTQAGNFINPTYPRSAITKISACCHNKKPTYKNCKWMFKENVNGEKRN